MRQASGNETTGFRGLRIGKGQFTGSAASIEMLTTALANLLGRPVMDHTALGGMFDFRLEWAVDAAQEDAPLASDSGGPSVFTALQEQLGLKPESAKGQVEILFIDHVERPSGN